jgi:uncharacterized repeat protein (TIGR04076 family)
MSTQVRVTVIDGTCQGGVHQVGQSIIVDETTPEGFCVDAWATISPYILALRSGGNFSWAAKKGQAEIHCPDPCGIVLRLERLHDVGGR